MPLTRPVIVILLLALVAFGMMRRCEGEEEQSVRRSRILMGTVVEITALGASPTVLQRAVDDAFAEMARIEELMSARLPGSDVARLNRDASDPLALAPETAEVLSLALMVAERSAGAFDPTLGRIKNLWDIEGEEPSVPAPAAIAEALRHSGHTALHLDGRQARKADPALRVDLGGIAKGYAIDRAAAVLAQAGVLRGSVNAGGDMVLLGHRGDRPWRIGIQHPRRANEIIATLELTDRAVVTSGDYERFFERAGVRYHHLFDPATGRPARRSQSVTVTAPNAALADALATAAFVLGPQDGRALLSDWPDVEGLIIDSAGEPHITTGLQDALTWR